MRRVVLATFAASLCATRWADAAPPPIPAFQHPTPVENFSASDILSALTQLKAATAAGLPESYVVKSHRTFDGGSVLASEEIVLSPGSTLVLGEASSDTREIFIIANKITVLPGSPAPVIAWRRPDAPANVPKGVGKTQSGASGPSSGSPGAAGNTGARGNPGLPGTAAPTIYLAVTKIDGGMLYMDLRGQDGGPGGEGQEGGDGGNGATGNPGSTSMFDCKRGGGNGGRGGNGGEGGPGGIGGRGGDGGTLILMADTAHLKELAAKVNVNANPGSGGPGGKGGRGGSPGRGGNGGSGEGFCRGGAPGPAGLLGKDGPNETELGPSGVPGTARQVPLTPNNVTGIGLNSPGA